MPMTESFSFFPATYKLKKKSLQAEAFDVTRVSDPLYFFDGRQGEYVPLTLQVYDDIVKGLQRL